MKTYTKESLIAELQDINKRGWIPNARPGNVGGLVGGLIARKSGTKRAAFLWGALLGLGFGLAGGVCGYFASGFLAQ